MTSTLEKPARYLTVNDWCKNHPWPPIGGLRYLIFHAETNGFKKVIKRVGKRILIHEEAFFSWIEQNGGQKNEK